MVGNRWDVLGPIEMASDCGWPWFEWRRGAIGYYCSSGIAWQWRAEMARLQGFAKLSDIMVKHRGVAIGGERGNRRTMVIGVTLGFYSCRQSHGQLVVRLD